MAVEPHVDLAIARRGLQEVFQACEPEQIETTLGLLHFRDLSAGEVLVQIDDRADCAFLLLEGCLQVYGRGPEHRLVAIATLDTPGRLLGDQALLPGHRFRNADVVALAPSRVAELSAESFATLLQADPTALVARRRQANEELQMRLRRLGVGLESLVLEPEESGSLQVEEGARLLEAGRIPERAYSIVAGQLNLCTAGSEEPLLSLGPGSLLGVKELLEQQPCQHDAVAATNLELLPIGRERLNHLLGSEETAGSLQALMAVPGLGRVYRSRSRCNGELEVISEYSDLPGGAVRVRQIPARRRIEASRPFASDSQLECCAAPDRRNQLLLEPESGRLVGLALDQGWPQLDELISLLLRDQPLTPLQQQAFAASGQLLLEAPEQRVEPASDLVCPCTGTTGIRLRELSCQGASLEDLKRLTAAGTVCGGCLCRLPLFLNQPPQARLCRIATEALAHGSRRVLLRPIEPEPLLPWRAGEHLLVEALIEGRWVGRSYTLAGGDGGHYELGVKQEPGGLLSTWLAEAPAGALVRIGSPQGQLLLSEEDPRPLLLLVAGIGVTPAMAAVRRLAPQRRLWVAYTFRSPQAAAYLEELRAGADEGRFHLLEHDSSLRGRLEPPQWLERLAPLLGEALEVVVCGPESFNQLWRDALAGFDALEVRFESFATAPSGAAAGLLPGSSWRLTSEAIAERRRPLEERFGAPPPSVSVACSEPLQEARNFLDTYRREVEPALDLEGRLAAVEAELHSRGCWHPTHAELSFGACLAWRQAERCVGRLHWQGLQLFDRRELRRADSIAEALFEHLRFAFHGGDLRPAISVFDPGEAGRAGPRIWNPQLLRYAGYRGSGGRQVGDPAQNALTARIIELGWRPSGGDFELLPLVIETAEEGPQLFSLPADCRQEVTLRHPRHAWLESLNLRWYAVPAVSDMALDLGGTLFRLAPFNGWYLDTEIAARNLSDTNRYNLLPRLAERLGFDLRDERDLWRDHAQLVLAEAVLHSFDQADVKISDHHAIGHEFLEFCRAEQNQGRDPQAEWGWVVPPMGGSLNVLYQQSFDNRALKPAFVPQPPIWAEQREAGGSGRCPFAS